MMKQLIAPAGLALASFLMPVSACAQTASVVTLQPDLSYEGAHVAFEAFEAEAEARDLNLAIIIMDRAGDEILLARTDGADHTHIFFARQKAETALTIGVPTKAIGERMEGGSLAILSIDGMIAVAGGVPITWDDKVIGAIGISGAPPNIDHEIATLAAAAVEAHQD
ncbi:MAG: heme-binding protein [Hyphomonadaceae bacterium]|nr:heme-binding protein [Hyphomonadaceae bacterium]